MDSASDLKTSQSRPVEPSKTISPRPVNFSGLIQPEGFPRLPEDWVAEWETFPGSPDANGDAPRIFGLILRKSRPALGRGHRALLVLHGLGEHGGRYLHFPYYLQEEIDCIYCIDHRGHGRSEGLRGHVERFDQLVEDALTALDRLDSWLRKKHGKSEIHLFGHSLGGHLVIRTLRARQNLPIYSAIASAPFLGIKQKVPVTKRVAARALARMWGTLQLDTGLNAEHISHDPAVVEAYRLDRLGHSRMTPRFYQELLAAMEETLRTEGGILRPLLLQVPLADLIVEPDLVLRFHEKLELEDKRLVTYEEFYHEPFNEVEKEKAFADLCAWIRAHHDPAYVTPPDSTLGEVQ